MFEDVFKIIGIVTIGFFAIVGILFAMGAI